MNTWDNFHNWHLVLPPSRPSTEQLAAIRPLLTSINRQSPVAILGSTPEFRDLVYEAGFQHIVVLDNNRRFHDLVTRLRVYQSEETLIFGDWQETIPRFTDHFGLILSDLTSGNIPYEHREQFYNAVTRALRPGGLFIDKVLTHPGPHILLDTLLAKYELMPVNLHTINTFSSEVLFCSDLLSRRNLVDSTLFYNVLDSASHTDRLRAFAQQSRYITPEGALWYYGKSWQQLEPIYCPTLVRSDLLYEAPTSPYFERVRHFKLVREGQ